MLVQDLVALALIKANVSKKRIIIVSAIIYVFFLFVFLNMFHRIFHNWWITFFNFFLIGGYMYVDMLDHIKEINAEKERRGSNY
jgi:hypothetical protein